MHGCNRILECLLSKQKRKIYSKELLTIKVPLSLFSWCVRLTLKGTMTPLASQKSSLTHFMVAGHSVIGKELIEFTLDDSGATESWVEPVAMTVLVDSLGIVGVGQQTPFSQGRCCKAKFRMANATNAIMDAADKQVLNTHTYKGQNEHLQAFQTWTILSWIPP